MQYAITICNYNIAHAICICNMGRISVFAIWGANTEPRSLFPCVISGGVDVETT